jgi:hypothetical protein
VRIRDLGRASLGATLAWPPRSSIRHPGLDLGLANPSIVVLAERHVPFRIRPADATAA